MSEMGEYLLRYLVIRKFRGKQRVISMRESLTDADRDYETAVAKLRDGDVLLAQTSMVILKANSGGYNRTRW